MPAFSLPHHPPLDHSEASPGAGRSPTTRNPCHVHQGTGGYTLRIRGFGGVLEPRYIVGARSLDQ